MLKAVEDLETCGVLAQDGYSGKVYLDLEDDWVFRALKVLEDDG